MDLRFRLVAGHSIEYLNDQANLGLLCLAAPESQSELSLRPSATGETSSANE
jgi:hypothetical protein